MLAAMTDFDADLALDSRCALGEGPIWDEREQALYFVDIEGQALHRFQPASGERREWPIGQRVGAAVLTRDPGRMVLACHAGFFHLSLGDGTLTAIADPEADRPGTRFNDGKVDPQGRFWAGTMVMQGEKHSGGFYRLDADGSAHQQLDGIQCSNGLAWNAAGDVLYYIDTPTGHVDHIPFDAASGTLGERRQHIAIPAEDGHPDGMCIDDDGHLWIAHWGGEQVACYDPESKRTLHRVRVPAKNITSCCFGGPDRDVLYITSARNGTDTEAFPQAGGVFSLRPGVGGPLPTPFAG